MVNGLHWGDERIVRQVNILIPLNHFVYTCDNLHEIPHGDERVQNKANRDAVLSCSGVDLVDISLSTTLGPIRVYYSRSVLTMGIESCVRGLHSMQANLFEHLFNSYEEMKINGGRDSNAARVDFGLGQGQPTSMNYVDNRGGVHRLPFCNLDLFRAMNDALKAEIRDLLLYFNQEFNGEGGPYNSCKDELRSKLVNDLFHDAGWGGSFVGWEYINISLRSASDTLYKHFDSKNDRRVGYNHAAIYSFIRSHCNMEYRVVIVMTYRNSMGCAVDRIREGETNAANGRTRQRVKAKNHHKNNIYKKTHIPNKRSQSALPQRRANHKKKL